MGLFRILLALAVVAAHSEQFSSIFAMVGGGNAVKIFFVISGFYIALILNEKYTSAHLFYTNRALRLYPAYFIVLLLCICWFGFIWFYIGYRPPPFWIAPAFSEMHWWQRFVFEFSNWLMLGVDIPSVLHFGNGVFTFLPLGVGTEDSKYGHWLGWVPWIRPGWSIGTEIWFYLLAPWIVRRTVLIQLVCAAFSIGLLAYLIRSYPLSYFFFPSNLGFFIVGSLLYRYYRSQRFVVLTRFPSQLLYASVATSMLFVGHIQSIYVSSAIMLACTLAIPNLFDYSKKNRIDTFLGDLSYPIYICHMLAISVMATAFKIRSGFTAAVVSIILAAILVIYIERPVNEYRQARVNKAKSIPN